MGERRSSSIPRAAVIAAASAVVAIAAVVALRGRSGDGTGSSGPAATDSAPTSLEALLATSATAPQVDPSQPKAQILAKTSIADAIAVARPLMTNTAGRLDAGSAVLALWASERLTWDALEGLAETSPALFRKDPEAERGKRFCISGTIVEIRAEKTLAGRLVEDRALPLIERTAAPSPGTLSGDPPPMPTDSAGAPPLLVPIGPDAPGTATDWAIPRDGKVYFAILKEKAEPATEGAPRERRGPAKEPLVVEIVAVRSSGTLVDGSDARACGALTGVTLPAIGTGTAPSDVTLHRIVGMFDLPENHGGTGEIAHHGG